MRLFKLVLVMLILVSIGCSSSSDTPLTPQYNKHDTISDNVPIIGASLYQNGYFNATGLLGMYELFVEPSTNTAELVAKRSSSIGESYVVNGISFFTIKPCAECLKLKSLALEPPFIKAVFTISHPFEKGNVGDPPTAMNRLDLDVFDLTLIVVPVESLPTEYPLTHASAYLEICANADGYTRELEEAVNDSAACPYFLVVDDSDTGTSTFNLFEMGTKNVEFDAWFAGGLFDLYLTMGYGASAIKANRLNPTYYNPEFNRKAAWKVTVTPPTESWLDNDNTTTQDVTVQVYDWQIGANVDSELTNPTDIYAASEVSEVTVEIPGMNNILPTANTPDSGMGTPDSPHIFTLPIANENLLAEGDYISLVKVTDERLPPASPAPGETDALVDVPDGTNISYMAIPEFATYQTFAATVVHVIDCGPVTGSITDPVCPISGITSGEFISFTAEASSANDGDPIVLYEWDHDYDGITFDAEFTGATADVGPFENPNCPDPTPVTYTVAVRATDSCDPPNVTVFATCEVTVDSCCSSQELLYDFTGCGTTSDFVFNCQGWIAGGCGLQNESNTVGNFKWGCDVGSPCGMAHQYLTSGGGSIMGGNPSCSNIFSYGSLADFNIVSPVINLPSSNDGAIEFDHCNAFVSGASFTLYISEDGCNGPWDELWNSTSSNGCNEDTTVDISGYSGSNIMFRFRFQSSGYMVFGGECPAADGNAGVVLDDVRIFGCFSGTLSD